MYCRKCGNEISDGANFCNKCGAKAAQAMKSLEKQVPTDKPIYASDLQNAEQADNDFKKFVDMHVRQTTRFQSADDLLTNGKPFTPLWIGAIVIFFVFTVVSFPTGILLGLFFGYVFAYLAGRIMYFRLYQKHCTGQLAEEIDRDDLIGFLNANLQYLSPYFSEWGDCGQNIAGEETIGCTFSRNILAIITFSENAISGKFYAISSRKGKLAIYAIIDSDGIRINKFDAGFGRLRCLYKTAPIVKATMEYYLNKNNEGENHNVLSKMR